jgi:hypothetical protein
MSGLGAGHVRLAGYAREKRSDMSDKKTALAVPENSKTTKKLIINGFGI